MKYQKILILWASFLFIPNFAQAEFTNAKCEHALLSSGRVQINRQWLADSGVCFIDVHPRPVSDDLKYRDYYFDNLGHFMVFNSYGYGPDAMTTAVRDFFIFPIVESYPDYSIEDNGDVIIKMVSGHLFKISAKDFSIISLTPGTFTEKPLLSTNQGGVEIQLTKGFWFDGGFKKGGSPLSQPNGKTLVRSSQSNATCSLQNNEFLKIDADGDYVFKFQKQQLNNFLTKRCPSLKL